MVEQKQRDWQILSVSPVILVRQVSQILFLNRHQRETQVCLAAELAPDFKFGGTEVDVASPAVAPCGNLAGIARLDRCLELDIVQTCIEGDIAGNLILDENRAALGHDFTLNHTRNYGIARKMPPGEELVLLDGVPCVCNSGLVDLRLIDEEHRFPVWQESLYIFFVEFHLVYGFGSRKSFSYSLNFLKAMQPSCPPKPNESEMPMVMSLFTAVFGV